MHLRRCEKSDAPRLQELFSRQGFEYQLPDFSSNNFIAKQVVEADGEVKMAVGARLTVELYMLADSEWESPAWRFAALKAIHEAMRVELKEKGITDAHIWVPPQIGKSFGRRLMRWFGWLPNRWPCFSRETGA